VPQTINELVIFIMFRNIIHI